MGARRFGPFILERLLGQGGMGDVWQAVRPGEEPVALKILQDQSLRSMFEDEARVLRGLGHPGIVRVHGLHRDRGRLGLEMELLLGGTLHTLQCRRFAEGLSFPVDAALAIGAALVDALSYLHAKEIVHRDVAPQNIMVEPSGRVVLLDFGVAWARARTTRTAVGVVKGRPTFMAPEQAAAAQVGPRADVYALGVLLWELLAGRPLFSRETLVADALHRPSPPPLVSVRSDVPRRVSALVEAMLVRDETRRIHTDDVQAVLQGFERGPELVAALVQLRTGTAELGATRSVDVDPAKSGPTAVVDPSAFGPKTGPTTAHDGPLMTWSTSGSSAPEDSAPVWIRDRTTETTPIDEPMTRAALLTPLQPGQAPERLPPLPRPSPSALARRRPGALIWINGLLFGVVAGLLWALLD